jgi:hypothetical protein
MTAEELGTLIATLRADAQSLQQIEKTLVEMKDQMLCVHLKLNDLATALARALEKKKKK